MARPGLTGGQYQPLNTEQIEQIHLASLDVLEHTGLQTENEEAKEVDRRKVGERFVSSGLTKNPSKT